MRFQVEPIFSRSEKWQKACENPVLRAFVWILLKLYTSIGMGWCVAPLVYLTFSKWWSIFCSAWFIGFIVWLPWPLYVPILKNLLGSPRKPEKKDK